jgi:hypothetical protein
MIKKSLLLLGLSCLISSAIAQNNAIATYQVTIRNASTNAAIVVSESSATTGVSIQSGILPNAVLLNTGGTDSFFINVGTNNISTWRFSINACQSLSSNNPPCQNISVNSYICTLNATNSTGLPTTNVSPSSNNGFGCVAKIVSSNIYFTISGTANTPITNIATTTPNT